MNCYYHPDKASLGTCKFCQRGLCAEDAALVDDALACLNRHEQQVHDLNMLETHTALNSRRMAAGYLRNAVFYGLAGSVFAAFGYYQMRWLGIQGLFLLLIGLFLLYASAANYFEGRKFK